MKTPAWLVLAIQNTGLREIKGPQHNSLILKMWAAIKRSGIKNDETPWCAAFVGWCLETSGIVSSRFESASSYLTWGLKLTQPIVGCVAVIERPGGHHVFFVVGRTKNGDIVGLGGNQGDAVGYAAFNINRIKSYRWPAAVPMVYEQLPIVSAVSQSKLN